MADFVREYIAVKNAYLNSRGGVPSTGKKNRSTGQALVPPPKMVPMTTWGDAMAVWANLKRIAEPSIQECIAAGGGKGPCSLRVHPSLNFVRTASFNRAKRDFDAQSPLSRVGGNPFTLATNVRSGLFYPHNEELWGYADDYVIARAGAGEVPFKFDMAVDSIKEAIAEAPGLVRDAVRDAANTIAATGATLRDILKWGAIGGGLFMLYWYVLRPSDRRGGQAG